MMLRNANLQVYQKNSFTYPPLYILPSFCNNASLLLFPKRLWNCASKIYFRKYKLEVALLAFYLFSYDSPKSTSFLLNVSFVLSSTFTMCHIVLSMVFVLSMVINWNLLQYKKHSSFLSLCLLICTFW